MVIDHVGLLFFPHIIIFRIIGRLALPIFAYAIVQGYQYTSDLNRYMKRLLVLAVISQIPYMLVAGVSYLNTVFTLLLGLMLVDSYEKKNYILTFLIILFPLIIEVDYSIYGLLLMLSFHVFKKPIRAFSVQAYLNIMWAYFSSVIQIFSLVGSLLSLFEEKLLPKIKMNKYLFYAFYPIHLMILYLIKIIFIY